MCMFQRLLKLTQPPSNFRAAIDNETDLDAPPPPYTVTDMVTDTAPPYTVTTKPHHYSVSDKPPVDHGFDNAGFTAPQYDFSTKL